jgi:putative transposase
MIRDSGLLNRSRTKYTADIRPLFRKAKEIAGKRPNVLISDGAPNYIQAFKEEFATLRHPKARHIRHIRLQGDHNNNKMERLNGEVRDREKVMRGLKKDKYSHLNGLSIVSQLHETSRSIEREDTR